MKALGAYRPLDELISSALGTLKRHTGGQVKDGGQEQAKDEGAPKAKDKGKDKIHVKKVSAVDLFHGWNRLADDWLAGIRGQDSREEGKYHRFIS